MPVGSSTSTILDKLIAACGVWRDVDVWDHKSIYTYYSEGRDIMLHFKTFPEDVPDFEIHDSLLATDSIASLSPNFANFAKSEHRAYSNDLFYEPIPYEMLYTDQVNP